MMPTDNGQLFNVHLLRVVFALLAMILALVTLYASPASSVLSAVMASADGSEMYGLLRKSRETGF